MSERGTLKIDKARKLLNFKSKNSIDASYIKYIERFKKFWKETI